MAIEYGTIAVVPKGEWSNSIQYEVANLVTRDGSSYVAHTKPPVGTLPTNTAYWQVSAQGTSKATAGSVGTVKPDGTTTDVSADGAMSVKTATQSALGLVKGSAGINVGTGGAVDVNTVFSQAAELANIIAGEAISQVLGKISKSIAVTMGLDQNALLKNMLTNMDTNDQNKINTAAYVHTLTERIGMGTELTAGANLTAALNAVNSNLAFKTLAGTNCTIRYNNSIVNITFSATNLTLNANETRDNIFALPPGCGVVTTIWLTACSLTDSWYPTTNNVYISLSGSEGKFNVRCTQSATSAIIAFSTTLPRNLFNIP